MLRVAIVEGGAEWAALAGAALPAATDPRVREEIMSAATYTLRLWFLLALLYVWDIEVGDAADGYTSYLLQHGYSYLYHVCYTTGDVFRYMYVLHARMDEYHGMARVDGVVEDGDADHGRAGAAAGVDGHKEGVAKHGVGRGADAVGGEGLAGERAVKKRLVGLDLLAEHLAQE